MKCDELTPIDLECNMGKDINGVVHREPWKAYDIDEVNQVLDKNDAEIASLKADNENLKDMLGGTNISYKQCYDEYKQCDKELCATRRALWLARAERADDRARIFYFNDLETMLDIEGFSYDSKKKKSHKKLTARQWRIIWLKVERKCRTKAEQYR